MRVVLDLAPPDGSGLELLRAWRSGALWRFVEQAYVDLPMFTLVSGHLYRERMIDHVAAEVGVVLVGLSIAARIFGPRQQGVLPRIFRREPLKQA